MRGFLNQKNLPTFHIRKTCSLSTQPSTPEPTTAPPPNLCGHRPVWTVPEICHWVAPRSQIKKHAKVEGGTESHPVGSVHFGTNSIHGRSLLQSLLLLLFGLARLPLQQGKHHHWKSYGQLLQRKPRGLEPVNLALQQATWLCGPAVMHSLLTAPS